MKLKKFLMAIALPVIALTFASCSNDDDDDTPLSKVPTQFTEAFQKLYPDAKGLNVEWEIKGNYRVAEYDHNNNMIDTEVWFNKNAERVMEHNDYGENLFFIPASINAAIEATQYAKLPWSLGEIDEYIMANGNTYYMFEANAKGEPETHIIMNGNGEVLNVVTGNEPDITPDYQF
ncbi:MAG: hypothetical protein K2H32_04025 [Muribaculaceae bacterium]|nr:hypothetical protein [Muribaculaceae bacterium]MDE5844798.1 hypothetical protein [Muribaculaceae bacterium]MDE5857506.1 hypothetical protein [Muribaculaceae bacterium]MDE7369185.1 hypothetical protein [Muribaculaceae bacterium]